MTSTTLALNELTRNAVERLEVGEESLCINKVYMWQNNMPHVSHGGTGANTRKGQHITVHIKRTRSDSTGLASTPPVVVAKLHVIQTSSVDAIESFSASSNLSGEGSNYFSWVAPSTSAGPQAGEVNETRAREENVALIRPIGWRGYTDEIEIQAWDGPDWGANKDFVALVEFEGGLVLRSDVHTADSVF